MTQVNRRGWANARALWVGGVSGPNIARILGVHSNTVYRWKKGDRQAGLDWEVLREQVGGNGMGFLVEALEQCLWKVATAKGLDPLRQAKAIAQTSGVLQQERRRLAKPMQEARKADHARAE